jgi:hypothetical protein
MATAAAMGIPTKGADGKKKGLKALKAAIAYRKA